MFKIVKREEMSEGNVILNEIEAPKIARKALPGQFVILKANEDGERIPLTMAETDAEKGTITIIYMVVGKSTALLEPLADAIGRHVRQGQALFADDTPVKLLAPGTRWTKTARVWGRCGARNWRRRFPGVGRITRRDEVVLELVAIE